jgi:hypothetical protein
MVSFIQRWSLTQFGGEKAKQLIPNVSILEAFGRILKYNTNKNLDLQANLNV